MRIELKNKLDAEEKRTIRKKRLVLLALLILLLGYGLLFFPIYSEIIQGRTISLTAVQTELGSLPRVRVRLSDGSVVRARMTQQQPTVDNAEVSLNKRRTILGVSRYYFLHYMEDDPDS